MLLQKTSFAVILLMLGNGVALAADAPPASMQKPAVIVPDAMRAPILAAARAGRRIVAAGDHGVILLSDDDGAHFRQADTVPTQALLTSLSFVDDRHGWAAGHDGVILHTEDGGDHWTLQREDLDGDKPLFSILFKDARHGFAVGLFGTAVQTADGGASWTPLQVEAGADTDHHLYCLFGDPATALYIAAENGLIYRSADGDASWNEVKTANPGSFWTGLQLRDGSLLAAGQRGHVFVSRDQGANWSEVPSGTDQSLTGIVQNADGSILITGLGGVTLTSADGAHSFIAHTRTDRVPLNAALAGSSSAPLLFGDQGVTGPERDRNSGTGPGPNSP
ncbi:MAG: YCF48-related protein [Nevskia sp.]|nr:YCF48-related protein [Nevskia sp.]